MPFRQSTGKSILLFALSFLERLFQHWTTPAQPAVVCATLTDLARSKPELIAENALLRQQLAILQRQIKRPLIHRRDRFWLLLLASRLAQWRQALVIIRPETLLRWPRAGFRLFWKHKSSSKTAKVRLAAETIALIQQLARENVTWGAERIRGELLKLGLPVAKRTAMCCC